MDYLISELKSLINWQMENQFNLSTHLIEDLISLIVTSRNLEDYYSNPKFSYKDSKDIMTYNDLNNINVYYNVLHQNLTIPEGQIFNNLEINLYPLIILLFIIYHEVEHVHQRQLWYYPEPTVESAIIKASGFTAQPDLDMICKLPKSEQDKYIKELRDKIQVHQDIYEKNKLFAPTERMANIRAYDFIQKLLTSNPNFEYLGELYRCLTSKYYYSTIKAYNKELSPTKYYLKQQQFYLAWWRLVIQLRKLSTDEKIYLGLRLTEKELIELANREENFSLKLTA